MVPDRVLEVFTDEQVPDLDAVYIKGHLNTADAIAIAKQYLRHLKLCWEEEYCTDACLDHQDYCSCQPDDDWFIPAGEIQHGFGGFEYGESYDGDENPLIFHTKFPSNTNPNDAPNDPITRCPTVGYRQQQIKRREDERDARDLILTRVPNSCILRNAGSNRYQMQLCDTDTYTRIGMAFYIQIDSNDKLTATIYSQETAEAYRERINCKGE
jgi:hypothetical protein